jgi:hypothetical protein
MKTIQTTDSDDDEDRMKRIAKRLLETPHKLRSESKIGKTKKDVIAAASKNHAPSAKPKTA